MSGDRQINISSGYTRDYLINSAEQQLQRERRKNIRKAINKWYVKNALGALECLARSEPSFTSFPWDSYVTWNEAENIKLGQAPPEVVNKNNQE
jgi:hypothetical protein